MNNKKVNRVRVKVDFPGYVKGDILELDPKAGVFSFKSITMEDGAKGDAFDIFAAKLSGEVKAQITKKEVLSYMDDIFEDISTYKVRSLREIEDRIEEIKAQMKRIEYDNSLDSLNTEEALTVWQNMLWEYEWILGMKELYNFSAVNSIPEDNESADTTISDETLEGEYWVDGNAVEEAKQKDEENSTDKNRESY